MLQLISFIIFLVSVAVIAMILVRKIPTLKTLPENGHHGFKKHDLVVKLENKIKETYFHWFSKKMLLHRILSQFRLWVLKLEKKTDELLHGIRKNAQELEKVKKRK